MKIKLSEYYKQNKKYMLENWRKEHIKQKYQYSICKFIKGQVEHISIDLKQYLYFDLALSVIEKDLYKSL